MSRRDSHSPSDSCVSPTAIEVARRDMKPNIPDPSIWISLILFVVSLSTRAQDSRISLECKKTEKGAEYMGRLSVTKDGLPCQRWDRQTPHAHKFVESYLFPDKNVTLAGNYCRNPAGSKQRPWCYTQTADVTWQYCAVPDCGCRKSKAGWDYSGKISVTSSGRRCQAWISQTPHSQSYTDTSAFPDPSIEDAGNYCRNPDRWETNGPWCYTLDPDVRWEYCNVPYCECKVSRGGHQYGGRISHTRSGRQCQRWDSQTPHAHRYADKSCGFPEQSVSEAANYCRNPEPNELEGPWCFTTDPEMRWEYCDIPMCGDGEDVYSLLSNTSTALNNKQNGLIFAELTSVELAFLGLFLASLLLTVITIAVSVSLVRMYRKRKSGAPRPCPKCQTELRLRREENAQNSWKLLHAFGRYPDVCRDNDAGNTTLPCPDTKYNTLPRYSDDPKTSVTSAGGVNSYASLNSAGKQTETETETENAFHLLVEDRKESWKDDMLNADNSNLYENISSWFNVIITPKSGKKQFVRRNSVS